MWQMNLDSNQDDSSSNIDFSKMDLTKFYKCYLIFMHCVSVQLKIYILYYASSFFLWIFPFHIYSPGECKCIPFLDTHGQL